MDGVWMDYLKIMLVCPSHSLLALKLMYWLNSIWPQTTSPPTCIVSYGVLERAMYVCTWRFHIHIGIMLSNPT